MTEEHKKKIGTANKGKVHSESWRAKTNKNLRSDNWVGNKRSKEDREKFRISHLGQKAWNKGKKMPNMSGSNHPNWKGGLSLEKGYRSTYVKRYKARKKGAFGSHTRGEWDTLKAQYNWTCPKCFRSEPEVKLTEDHIIPISKGGSDNIENIQPLCLRCNCAKGNRESIRYLYKDVIK